MDELDRILNDFTSPINGLLHGAAFIAVDKNGNIIYQKATGRASPDPGIAKPLDLDSLYWIASMTKLATAVAVVQLVERGVVSLDDEVRDKVPELKDLQVLRGMKEGKELNLELIQGKITLRHLLSHAPGSVYDSSPLLQRWSESRRRTAHAFSGSMDGYRHPLIFQPGTSWGYGAGLDWAGQMIEHVTDSTLEEYMHANIWSRIGATSTTFHPELRANTLPSQMEMGERVSVGQGVDSLKPGRIWLGYPLEDDLGGIGLFSTPLDFIRLLSTLLQGGSPLLSKESVDLLFRPQLSHASRAAMPKALGKQMRRILGIKAVEDCDQADHSLAGPVTLKDIPGRRRRATASWSGLPNTHWWVDREAGVAAALFTQIMPPADAATTDLLIELEKALYKAISSPRHPSGATRL
ncbi:serine hydrolase domain-containing protein [Aspergillus mulundensis]|uniref:Beta-lactamase-related domain-containing protein n=1 Tax=Aspergillus mulundensis TaxID=1810919 RepID=A0A3D8QRS0_9EURO|nr:Uncharacterized protein DSM5745_09888 [Aspergillus mulundensis]RDW64477.1 Uncharacterized protein DSM5745_09888 [Aspergillus mulundensis]